MKSQLPTERVDETALLERLKKAQEYVRSIVPSGVSLADELIAERRKEARYEFDNESK